jgi:anti-sigma regulatory factor (Ser/Thr protein kinase)
MLVETNTAHHGAAAEAASRTAGGHNSAAGFHHESLFYSGEEEFLAGTLVPIEQALELGRPVLVAAAQERIALLRRVLRHPRASRVGFVDMRALGLNPARMIPAWSRFLRENACGGRPALGIGEPVWPGRTADELAECERHEWLLNLAFRRGQPWRLLCPYDRDRLDERVLNAARSSHPFNCCGGACDANDDYRDPDWSAVAFNGALPPPPGAVTELAFSRDSLAEVRGVVGRAAARAGLAAQRADELVLAVDELATNSVLYGGGRGRTRIWQQDGALVCEVSDAGHLRHPLAGRVQPRVEQLSGRGLWLVNQVCDLVQIRSGDQGTVVRVRTRDACMAAGAVANASSVANGSLERPPEPAHGRGRARSHLTANR